MLKRFVPLLALGCAPFISGPLAYGQNHPDHPPLVTGPGGQIGIHGPNGKFIGIDDDPEAVLGGTLSNPFASFAPPKVIGFDSTGVILDYKINKVLGSKWSESFLVGMPIGAKLSSPLPVLVLFHGHYKEPFTLLQETNYFSLAMKRGWIVIAPRGAHKFNFGIEYSQKNVGAALQLLVDSIAPSFGASVDLNRFYAVGFSMGGGAAMSFAARHLDSSDDGLRFAGVVNHTGTTSMRRVHEMADLKDKNFLESGEMFGGSPDERPFRYPRVSSIDLDTGLDIDPGIDMVRNLVPVPVLHYYCIDDPNTDLITQTKETHDHLLNTLGGDSTLWTGPEIPGNGSHDWQNLPEQDVLDWLAPKSYQAPQDITWVSTLADRDGVWHCFEVSRAVPRVFSPFNWMKDSVSNIVLVRGVANIARLNLPSPKSLGLKTATDLTYHVDTADNVPMKLILGEFTAQPTTVTRNNKSASWSWDAATSELTLDEPSNVFATWRITP